MCENKNLRELFFSSGTGTGTSLTATWDALRDLVPFAILKNMKKAHG